MNLTETIEEESEMRSDYSLYIVALICFIIAGVILADAIGMEQTMSQVSIVIFTILGLLFIAGGYTLRPKALGKVPETPTISTIETTPTSTPTPTPPAEEQVSSAPTALPPSAPTEEATTPAPTSKFEEPTKIQQEKPAEKPVRRRRRKKTA